MTETKSSLKKATVGSCFELVGFRQYGVAARSREVNQHRVSCLLNDLKGGGGGGEEGGLFNKALYGEAPPRGPSLYPFMYNF